jgi:hypothetical protein
VCPHGTSQRGKIIKEEKIIGKNMKEDFEMIFSFSPASISGRAAGPRSHTYNNPQWKS